MDIATVGGIALGLLLIVGSIFVGPTGIGAFIDVPSFLIVMGGMFAALMITYPMTTGRNFDEILRVIDSMQLTAAHKVATPVNWQQGDDVIIVPSVSDEEAKTVYPEGFDVIKPYLRKVKQPS